MTASAIQPGIASHPNYFAPSLNPQLTSQSAALNLAFRNFISHCDAVLVALHSAQTTESADSMTSNTSLFGHFISNISYNKNHQVANQVDALCQEANHINQIMLSTGLHSFIPLDTTFNGDTIRFAENDEHHFFLDWFSNGTYSSIASMNTLRQLQNTEFKVNCVRNQAQSMLYSLPMM